MILVCADAALTARLSAVLEPDGCRVQTVVDGCGLDAVLALDREAALVLDTESPMFIPGSGAFSALQLLAASRAVVLLAEPSAANANSMAHAWACGALVLPLAIAPLALPQALARAVADMKIRHEMRLHRTRAAWGAGLARLQGLSIEMLRAKTQLRLWLDDEMLQGHSPPVLLLGPAGTGKSEMARVLHFGGTRRDQPYVVVDSTVLSGQDPEAVLFGSTSADGCGLAPARDRGLAELAAGGTLYITEVAQLGLAVQSRLLRWLDEAQRQDADATVDSRGDTPVEMRQARLVVATSHPPSELVHSGRLLPELLQLLRPRTLRLAPLADRDGDVCLLFQHFLEEAAQAQGRPVPTMTVSAMDKLGSHTWPGQLHELRLLAQRAVELHCSRIDGEQLVGLMTTGAQPLAQARAEQTQDLSLHRVEKEALQLALQRSRGNVSEAARLLGVSRDTLRFRINRHGLTRGPSG